MKGLIVALFGSCTCGKPNGRHCLVRVGVLVLLCMVGNQAHAQTLTTICSFGDSNGNGPCAGLTPSSDGQTLYGTTFYGGTNNYGTVFGLPVGGGSPTTLVSFNGYAAGGNGAYPVAGLTLSANGQILYGTTWMGGVYGDGTVFSVPVGGGSHTVLASFNGPGTGAGVTLSANGQTLYGTTGVGGTGGYGAVFSVPVSGGSPTTLASFNGNGAGTDGGSPQAGLTLSANGQTLYGTTQYGGAYGYGTVFSVPVLGGSPTTLASFSGSGAGTNGAYPVAGLTLSANGQTLYGTTSEGGTYGDGAVFSIATSGGSDAGVATYGSGPRAGLTLSANGQTLYGTTYGGGDYGYGMVFSVPVGGGGATTLASFNASGAGGGYSTAGLTLSANRQTLYGTTTCGGDSFAGTVFALNIAPATIVVSSDSSATIITGGTGAFGMTLSNSPTSGYNLNYMLGATVTSGSAALSGLTPSSGSLAPGGSQPCTISATSTNLGVNVISLTASDPNSSNLSETATASLTVLDHAAAAFANGSGTLDLDFGTLQRGSGTQALQFQIQNLPAAYRAGLDLLSITPLSDPLGVFSTDASPFTDLAPGAMSPVFDVIVNTSQTGEFSGVYQFNLSDEQDLSGWGGQQTLTLDVTAEVVPEPATLVLLGVGALGLLGFCGQRPRRPPRRLVWHQWASPDCTSEQSAPIEGLPHAAMETL